MGFQHKPKNIVLKFDDSTEYAGFECTLRGLRLGEYMDVIRVDEVDNSAVGGMLEKFAESLIGWNLEDEQGQPIPATQAAVYEQDKTFMLTVAEEWANAIHGVSAPLEQTSPAGEPWVAASIPMATLSESLAS
ncbi:hypothetical protein ACFV1F_16810 [Streptomyces sp. NPDC059590]|uniref:hypothetical protein n=1 Tax=Streptomyces sp. NPDC059590 TaxID=3346877 RepID=UPI003673C94B